MRRTSKIMSVLLSVVFASLCFSLIGCGNAEKKYSLTVNGGEYLYENLNKSYKVGEEIKVKVKITPYEGVKALLDGEQLVKAKSSQDDYWLFTFRMPARNVTLDIKSFKGFEEPRLYGFYVTFTDKDGEPIEALNKDVKSDEAVADYFVMYYENGHKVYSHNDGANVFAESRSTVGNIKIELESTLYFTYQLLDSVATVRWVFFDEETQDVHFYDIPVGYKLNDVGYFSLPNDQHLTDTRYNGNMKEYEEKFDSYVKINLKYLDYLTGVKVLEYSADNQLIKSTDISKNGDDKNFIASETCEYVVIEEEYTVMNDKTRDGETYCERTLINKNEFGGGRLLKYPRGDGLISPVYLSVDWQSETQDR